MGTKSENNTNKPAFQEKPNLTSETTCTDYIFFNISWPGIESYLCWFSNEPLSVLHDLLKAPSTRYRILPTNNIGNVI